MSESEGRARVLSSRSVHEGRVVRLRVEEIELPSGRRSTLELIHHPGAAAARALDGGLPDGKSVVALLRAARYLGVLAEPGAAG